MSRENPQVQVLLAPIDQDSAGSCLLLARNIRAWGISCLVDGRAVRLKKKIEWAVKMDAFFVLIVGPDDIAAGVVQIKDLDESTQQTVPLANTPRYLAGQLLAPDEMRRIKLDREVEDFNKQG
jgi:histidyl-tRNA synthetase